MNYTPTHPFHSTYQKMVARTFLFPKYRWFQAFAIGLLAFVVPALSESAPVPAPSTVLRGTTIHFAPKLQRRWVAARKKKRKKSRRKKKKLPDKPINLNAATIEDLMQLPRIGRSKAQKILELRQQLGGQFSDVEQLRKVRGIGKRTLEKLRPYLAIGPKGAQSSQTTPSQTAKDPDDPPRRRRKSRKGKRKQLSYSSGTDEDTGRPKRRKRRKARQKSRRSRGGWRSQRKSFRSKSDSTDSSQDDLDNPPHPDRDVDDNAGSGSSTNTAPVARTSPPSGHSASHSRKGSRSKKKYRGKRGRNCYTRWMSRTGGRFAPVNINVADLKALRSLPCIGRKRAQAIVALRSSQGPFKHPKELRSIAGIGKKIYAWLTPYVTVQLDLNRATLAQLEALAPLSGGLGQAIFKHRKRHGKFRSLRALLRVRGMGRSTFERIKPFLTITAPATPTADPPGTRVIKIQ